MSRRKRIIVAVMGAIVAVILVAVVRHYQLRVATSAYIARLKAEGEPMELAQVVPPSVPPDQNSADTFRQAATLLEANQNWEIRPIAGPGRTERTARGDSTEAYDVSGMVMVAPGKAMILWQQPDVHEDNGTFSWQDIAAVLAKNEKTLALLQQIIGKPDFDFQIEYERGLDDPGIFTNLFLAESKRAAQRLSTSVLCNLHNGDTASAVENLRAMLALAQALRNERFAISELVRIATAQIAVAANWDLLQAPDLTDAQLAQLQQDWAGLDFVESYKNALEMERVNGIMTLAGERSSNTRLEWLENLYHFGGEKAFMWRYWWSYSDELRALKGKQVLINAMRMAETNGSFQDALQYQNEKLDKLGINRLLNTGNSSASDQVDLHAMQSRSVAVWGSSVIRRVMRAETAKGMVITAIALKRYQLKSGNYPPDLNALVPKFLPAVPLDPADGQPLRYLPKANGTFLLYSVGENGKDDGGNPSLEPGIEGKSLYWLNPHALDWVWPQPATKAEIEYYYEHPPK